EARERWVDGSTVVVSPDRRSGASVGGRRLFPSPPLPPLQVGCREDSRPGKAVHLLYSPVGTGFRAATSRGVGSESARPALPKPREDRVSLDGAADRLQMDDDRGSAAHRGREAARTGGF